MPNRVERRIFFLEFLDVIAMKSCDWVQIINVQNIF